MRRELGLPVGILFPVARRARRASVVLEREATFVKRIRPGVLRMSLLADPVSSRDGDIAKPTVW